MGVREGLLALLDRQPAHGYQLKTGFEAATGGVWSLNVGQVYATLERLERDGLVASDETDAQTGKRPYRITEAGADELGAWWAATPGDEPPPRDELMVKVLLAIAHDHARALDVVTSQRSALMTLLQRRRRETTRTSATGRVGDPLVDRLVDRLVGDALVVRAEADLRWLDLCEERLIAARDAGAPAPATRPRARNRGRS
jgi:DNA-binding PadR family transcriptional regulator